MREPSASPEVIHGLEVNAFCVDVDTPSAGRKDNSMTASRASERPVLLYPPVFSFINGHTGALNEQWRNGTTKMIIPGLLE